MAMGLEINLVCHVLGILVQVETSGTFGSLGTKEQLGDSSR